MFGPMPHTTAHQLARARCRQTERSTQRRGTPASLRVMLTARRARGEGRR